MRRDKDYKKAAQAAKDSDLDVMLESDEEAFSHPSTKRDDVSPDTLGRTFTSEGSNNIAIMANIIACAVFFIWMPAVLFLPDAFIYDKADFSQFAFFQEAVFFSYLLGLAACLLFKQIPARRWSRISMAFLLASPLWIILYQVNLAMHAPSMVLDFMSLVAHVLLGMAMGLGFCCWIRFYIRFSKNVTLQLGLSLLVAGIFNVGLSTMASQAVVTIVVTALPLVFLGAVYFMDRVATHDPRLSPDDVLEGTERVRIDRKLIMSLAMVGFVYGVSYGFVMDGSNDIRLCSCISMALMAVLGVVLAIVYQVDGRNPGFTIPTSLLLGTVCLAQSFITIFHERFLPVNFALLFIARLLFACVLLLQLPRVFQKKHSLKAFFTLWLVFQAAEFVGLLLRHLLFISSGLAAFDYVSALLMTLAIGTMVMVLTDTSVATAWSLIPLPKYHRKRFSRACDALKSEYGLTARELEIMMMAGRGRSGPYIQEKLFISKSTYQTHMRNLYKKLDIHTDQELIDIIEMELDKQKEPNS
ncbi:MAG: hypothetical protein IJH83_01410 [Coriobacteriales bacterium]|nr:hypothetical protein [Coriobacteriales bacterium]